MLNGTSVIKEVRLKKTPRVAPFIARSFKAIETDTDRSVTYDFP